MKRIVVLALLLSIMNTAGMAVEENIHSMPDDMLPVLEIQLPEGHKCAVYSGPGEEFFRPSNGKAVVSTNDWVQVFGNDFGWVMIRYALSEGRTRIGYINEADLPEAFFIPYTLPYQFEYGRAVAKKNVKMTDDPFLSETAMLSFAAGTEFITLHRMEEWWYVETIHGEQARGFIRADQLETLPIPYQEKEHYAKAAALLEAAGITFTVRGLYEKGLNKDIYFALKNGSLLNYYAYGDEFSPYDVTPWNVPLDDMSEADASRFIHYFLNEAIDIQEGRAIEEHLQPDYQGNLGQRNMEAAVRNILFRLESFGNQGLSIMMDCLAAHDGNDSLNSLRAQLASRILGRRDKTPVDPQMGCEWYDALCLAIQDNLPHVEAATYEDDPLAQAAAQAIIDEKELIEYSHDSFFPDVDRNKAKYIIGVKIYKTKKTAKATVLWANVSETCYALYDGENAFLVSGQWAPCRLEMKKDQQGNWQLEKLIWPQDGELYSGSILAFCDGDRQLADHLMKGEYVDTDACFQKYLAANGYGRIQFED